MKRILCLMLTLALLISSFAFQTAFAEDDIKVLVNGKSLTMDQPPVLVNDRTLVPVRAIFEALGAKVDWNNDTNTAKGVLGNTTVEIQIENTVAKVNGKDVTLDVPAKLISDRTLVPVRFISESLGAKVDWNNDTQTVIITKEDEGDKSFKKWTFDDLSAFENNKDFVAGGAYDGSKVSLSAEQDHTTGSGKSLKMADKTNSNNRIKLKNVFSEKDIGKTFTISAYFYIPDERIMVRIGTFGESNTDFATSPSDFVASGYIAANTWTKVEFTYTHKDKNVTQLGFEQYQTKNVPTIYIDDIEIKEGTNNTSGESTSSDVNVNMHNLEITDGHRPVPTNFKTGKNYEDILYYGTDKKSADELLATLPKGDVIVDNDHFISMVEKNEPSQYGTLEVIEVSGQPFKKAVRATVYAPTEPAYLFKFDIGNALDGKAKEGDVCLLKLYMRTEKGGATEAQMGQGQVIIEQNGGHYAKNLTTNVSNNSEWKAFYFPFTHKDGYTSLSIRLGFYTQVVDFAGYEITNYGDKVKIEDLPTDSNSNPSLAPDAKWRKDAWDRIEKIRKGDFKVIVKDKDGNVIPDADVKLDMYDHEFEWGTAITQNINNEESYQADVQKNFNSVVFEGNMKWTYYEDDKPLALQMAKSAKDLGIKNIRGHLLIWDYLPDKKSSGAPMRINDVAEDKEALLKMQKEHIDEITEAFAKYGVKEWDVLNEAMTNNYFRTKYGFEMINTWYNMAREALGKDGVLYYNDFRREKEFYEFMDEWIKNGVDFDGIGIQSHYGSPENPETINEMLDKMAKYGKRLKVTEYDFTTFDNELQANFTRDFMITSFAHEAMDGFYIWQFRAYKGNNKRIFYDENGNAKPAMEVWQDLIYNKWWTNESGKTGADGAFSARGFYGDYDVSVTANGKTKKVSVPLYKNGDNTVTVTLD